MHLVDDHGRAMDAEYHVEADSGHLALVMERRSGMSGTRAPRNTDYNRALTILLARLGRLSAVLVHALVDSRAHAGPGLARGRPQVHPGHRSSSRWNQTRMPCDAAWVQRRPRSRRRSMRAREAISPSVSACASMFPVSRQQHHRWAGRRRDRYRHRRKSSLL